MQLDLSDEDRDLLVGLVERTLGETRVEARHTDDRGFRERLHREQESLRQILERLRKLG
jgi:hypothetical protein